MRAVTPEEAAQIREAVRALRRRADQIFTEERVELRSEHVVVYLARLLDRLDVELRGRSPEQDDLGEIRQILSQSLAEIATEEFGFQIKPGQLT